MAQGNQDWKNWNEVKNWRVRVFEMKMLDSGAVNMRCAFSGKKKKNKDGTDMVDENGKQVYAESLYGWVYCDPNKCEVEEMDYTNENILVNGTFSLGDFTDKNGVVKPSFTIFASKIVLSK